MYKHQINSLPQTFSDYFIKHSQSITILQEMPKITVFIKPKKFSLIEQYELPGLLYGILWIQN